MPNKPTYAAVAANEASPTAPKQDQPHDAPPPYSGPSGSQQPPPPQPVAVPQPHHLESGPPAHIQGHAPGGWSPPPTPQVARSRAIRRFWVAFLWAWLIWVFVGFIIGGGVSDMKGAPMGRHGHWDKHGDWRNDASEYPYSWFGYSDDQAER